MPATGRSAAWRRSAGATTGVDAVSARNLPGAGFIIPAALLALTVWTYWSSLVDATRRWTNDPQYSHGFLVPLIAVGLLWSRRGLFPTDLSPRWWGVPLVVAGISLRIGAAYYYFEWIEALSLLPVLLGIAAVWGGWPAWRWSGSAILFLFFMIPLPYTLDVALTGPLRTVGTLASTYILQTCGVSAYSEGNIISLGSTQIGVAEACSGLRMMMIFFALSTAVALYGARTRIERLVLIVSAVPIALIANITRITVTGLLHASGDDALASLFFHDLAGWLMMPFGLLLLQLVLSFVRHLVIVEDDLPMTVGVNCQRGKGHTAKTGRIVPIT
jgi:exosortase